MVFLVPYAYDRMPGGKPREGVPPNRLGSKARLDALLNRANEVGPKLSSVCRFILTAGFTKKSIRQPTLEVQEGLASQMEKYLKSQGFHPAWVYSHEQAWGTFEETFFAIEKIVTIVDYNWIPKPLVYVSTNLGHMPRVMLCWFFLKPKGWKVRFVLAKHSFTFWPEYFQETAKFFQYLYRFLFRKW